MSVTKLRKEIDELLTESNSFSVANSGPDWYDSWFKQIETVLVSTTTIAPNAHVFERKFRALVHPSMAYPGRAVSSRHAIINMTRMLLVEVDEFLADTGAKSAGPFLSFDQLHPWVWNDRTRSLWSLGQFAQAVHEAASRIDYETQRKIGRSDVSGKELALQAWTLEKPKAGKRRLRFPGLEKQSQSRTSAHEGAMHFGVGLMQGIRNRTGHDSSSSNSAAPMTEVEAATALVSMSHYATWVAEAQVKDARGQRGKARPKEVAAKPL